MARLPRYERLDGIGRIRAYDNGGRSMDRYLVLFEDMPTFDERTLTSYDRPRPYGPRFALCMSDAPSSPQGVGQSGYYPPPQTWGRGADHRRVRFADLPELVQECVRSIAD